MIDDDLITIIAKVFSIPESEVNDQSSPENIDSWDSFNGLVLVDELENHFKVKFTISEITAVSYTHLTLPTKRIV